MQQNTHKLKASTYVEAFLMCVWYETVYGRRGGVALLKKRVYFTLRKIEI